jgi:hypothetical protein
MFYCILGSMKTSEAQLLAVHDKDSAIEAACLFQKVKQIPPPGLFIRSHLTTAQPFNP